MRGIDGTSVLLLSVTGAAIGFASLFGWWPVWVETAIWTAAGALLWTPLLVRRQVTRPILTGALGGLASGAAAGGQQAAFLALYATNRPDLELAVDAPTRAMLLLSTSLLGLLWGALFGTAAWAMLRRRAKADEADPTAASLK